MTTSISLDVSTVLTFDAEGRPWSALLEGIHYRRGFDGRVRARSRTEGSRTRRWLPTGEREALWARVHGYLRGLLEGLEGAGLDMDEAVRPDLENLLRRLLSWDAARLARDVTEFGELYTSVPILPPDRYNALLVQVTRGCAWNRCTFCDLYRDRPYEVRSAAGLDEHMVKIRAFFGSGLQTRRHLFLGDANILAVPSARLLPLVASVRAAFPEPAFRELSAFADVLGPRRHTDDDLRALSRLGLRHIYLGLESGSDAVLGLLGKAGGADAAVTAVRRLHKCGLSVGVIVLLGAGGDGLAHEHIEETVRTLREMRLAAGDITFFSPLRAGGEYARHFQTAGLRPLTEQGMQRQRQRIEAGLRPHEAGGPRRSGYDVEDFVY
jgi:radical SAM superfamily enzyme YgiQ (UPF0313 family)